MAQYLVLIYEDEAAYATADSETWQQVYKEHEAFAQNHGAALRGGNALQPTSTATSVRRDGAGGVVVTDGPFAETKEALGGYYLIEAADLDEALAVAQQVPARFGGVEVRPVMTFD
ncbi:MAG: YciI family protein [Actinomycetota bacterium]|nr:YciI family protein [Actinomycetota bacterium]